MSSAFRAVLRTSAKRVAIAAIAVVTLAVMGCSTNPIADTLDYCWPGRFPADAQSAGGGVCIPQRGPAGGILGAPPPGAVVIPGPGGPFMPPSGPIPMPPPAPLDQTPFSGVPR